MNILIVTPYFPPQTGGVATFVDSFQLALRQRGHEISILLQGSEHDVTPLNVNNDLSTLFSSYLRVPQVRGANLRSALAFCWHLLPTFRRLRQFIKAHKFDLILMEYPMPYMWYFPLIRTLTGVKLIVGIHGDDVLSMNKWSRYEQWMIRWIIRRADCLLAHSSSLLSQAEQIVSGLTMLRSYVRHAVDVDNLRVLAEAGNPQVPKEPYILVVAKLYERKGVDVLLHAIRYVGTLASGYRFLIVGDGPEELTLRKLADQLGILNKVNFVGELQRSDIASLYAHCEFFVLPSRSEPFGIVLLEAMVFGKAVLATRVGGIPEFICDGKNGILVEAEDAHALGDEIVHLINDKALRQRIASEGLRLVEQDYTYDCIVHKYEQLFSQVCRGKVPAS